ncbi:MAG: hypothetical protein ICV78_16865 [Tolypothrix sp. Co-bin9]|nr:hypothetical protein [Tolypothrix sp. Co-bin9]
MEWVVYFRRAVLVNFQFGETPERHSFSIKTVASPVCSIVNKLPIARYRIRGTPSTRYSPLPNATSANINRAAVPAKSTNKSACLAGMSVSVPAT